MSDPRPRQIKIKTGVLKRLLKDKVMYEKEAELQKQRIERMKAEKKDFYDIKKQEEVLQESLMIIPDCQKRLMTAYTDLHDILKNEEDLAEAEEYKLAAQLVEEATSVVN
ncbi:TBCA (predicted) [Pycnogonum litorale]